MRWLRYALYSCLLLVALAGILAGWFVHELRSRLDVADSGGESILAWAEASPARPVDGAGALTVRTLDLARLASPPASARPWTRWWWPGADIQAAKACDQLARLQARGFGGVEIQPFSAGLHVIEDDRTAARINDFDSDAWYAALDEVMACAGRLDMSVYLNHLSGWPAGGPQVALRDGLWTLRFGEALVEGGTEGGRDIQLALPVPEPGVNDYLMATAEFFIGMELGGFAVDQRELLAVVAARITGGQREASALDATDTVELDPQSVQVVTDLVVDGRLQWRVPPGRWMIIAAYRMPSAEAPTLIAAEQPGYVIDHLDREKLRAHYDYAYGSRTGLPAHYGGAFRGFFNDSLEFKLDRLASEDILSAFAERRGYDLTPHLPAVFVDAYDNFFIRDVGRTRAAPSFRFGGTGASDERIRYDYQLTLSDLVIERFAQGSADWAAERGLLSRGQTYGFEMDTLRALGANHIPETEHLWGNSSEYVMKLAGSAALLYGRPLVSAESFVWAKRAYAVTARHIKAGADLLFLSGVNHVIYHGVPYVKTAPAYRDAFGSLGWYPFMGPDNPSGFAGNYGPVSPVWDALPALNDYIARSQQILQAGVPSVEVLVYYPFLGFPKTIEDSALAGQDLLFGGRFPGEPAVEGERALDIPLVEFLPPEADPRVVWLERLIPTLRALAAQGITWNWVNGHALESGRAAATGARAVLVADVEAMSPATVEALASMLADDMALFFLGELPHRQPGFRDHAAGDRKVASMARQLAEGRLVADAAELASLIQPTLGISGARALRRVSRVDNAGNVAHLLVNRSLEPLSATVTPATVRPGANTYWFDAASGSTWPAIATPRGGFELTLGPLESRFLLVSPQAAAGFSEPLSVRVRDARTSEALDGTWVVSDGEVDTSVKPPLPLFGALPQNGGEPVDLVYATRFESAASHEAMVLDLGEVVGVAHVQVNGMDFPPVSFDPFLVDISSALRAGGNELRVRVSPPLRNALVTSGEATHEAFRQFGEQLTEVGLRGPVTLHALPERVDAPATAVTRQPAHPQ